jgi:ribonuclease BN (tRNA processing enzyme)
MKLTVVGCSPAWPNPAGAQSSYLVESAGGSVLLDCGPGALSRLRTERSIWPDPDAIVITHFHLDHWGDLVPWVWGALYLRGRNLEQRKPALWVPSGGIATLAQFGGMLGFVDMFERVFELAEYTEGEPFEAGGCSVAATKVPHYTLDAYALRVSDGERTLVYSADSGPSDALVEAARDADLFLCEATLYDPAVERELRGHLTLEEAHEAFVASGARRLLVTHRPAELETPTGFEYARDGLVMEV